jgi:glutamate-1-semialdehyde 2,1-aminomutase
MLTDCYMVQSAGNKVQLSNGRRYTDWSMGLAGPLYGYTPYWWWQEVSGAAVHGTVTSIRNNEQECADLLGGFYPDIEAVRFMQNGSDPCAAAVKLARAITGRSKILSYGYHGTSSAFAKQPSRRDDEDNSLGTMAAERDAYVSLEWMEMPRRVNGLAYYGDSADSFFTPALDDIAAIVVECPPIDGHIEDAGNWLDNLGQGIKKAGGLFILDEVVTGFRYGPMGALGYYEPLEHVDLICFGKTLGNGYPVAALAGKRDVMQWLAERPGGGGRVHWSNTFNGCNIGLAAIRATLTQLKTNPPWDHLYSIGDYLIEQWNGLDLPYILDGHPTRPIIDESKSDMTDFEALRRHLFERGHIVVAHPWYMTTETTRVDVDSLVDAVGEWV